MRNLLDKKIVFITPPTHPAVTDYGAILTSHVHTKKINKFLSATYPIGSWGLFWIKENCPHVDILDMPSFKDLEKLFKNPPDILGISFYTYQVNDVIKIVEMARKSGVKEIWGGNYGVQTPGVDIYFDKIIEGNGEEVVHELVYGKKLDVIRHPFVEQEWKIRGAVGSLFQLAGFNWTRLGVLWTIKGCYYKCKFCASPKFVGKTKNKTRLAEVNRILDEYIKAGIRAVTIMDLDFMMDAKYAEEVIDLLFQKNIRWSCMTRVDHIRGRVRELQQKGCEALLIGVESLNMSSMLDQNKYKYSQKDDLMDLFDELRDNRVGYYVFYMLGFENDTVESLKREIDYLVTTKATFYQFQVVTPLPGSEMFRDYKHLVTNWNWDDWHCHSLVWKHPNITPEQMDDLLVYAKKKTSLFRILRGMLDRGSIEDFVEGQRLLKATLKTVNNLYKRLFTKPGQKSLKAPLEVK